MPKKILSALLIALFVLPIFSQVANVSAKHTDKPITSPITNPVTFFSLTGKVTYKNLGRFFKNVQRIVPADDVIVKVTGFFDKKMKYTTTTDANGMYQVELPKGLYTVEVKSDTNDFFVPPFKVVSIKENKTKKANFQGLIFP